MSDANLNGAKVYVVTMWGGLDYPEHCGVLGVFVSTEDAQRAIDKAKEDMGSGVWGEVEERVIGKGDE